MMTTRQSIRWEAVGASITGVAHARSGQPNQDAIRIAGDAGDGPAVIAVADGHGSAPSFRSDEGARIAVCLAAEHLLRFHRDTRGQPPATIADLAMHQLPQRIVAAWHGTVREHHRRCPFSVVESGESAPSDTTILLAYGATLLAALVDETFGLFLQMGDGDILTVADRGDVSAGVERDARLIANETTSLCQTDAATAMHLRVREWGTVPPALILLSTDGYGNSFADDAEFRKIGPDYLNAIRTDGGTAVQARLDGWLTEASRGGSGDDITLGILYRDDLPRSVARDRDPSRDSGLSVRQLGRRRP